MKKLFSALLITPFALAACGPDRGFSGKVVGYSYSYGHDTKDETGILAGKELKAEETYEAYNSEHRVRVELDIVDDIITKANVDWETAQSKGIWSEDYDDEDFAPRSFTDVALVETSPITLSARELEDTVENNNSAISNPLKSAFSLFKSNSYKDAWGVIYKPPMTPYATKDEDEYLLKPDLNPFNMDVNSYDLEALINVIEGSDIGDAWSGVPANELQDNLQTIPGASRDPKRGAVHHIGLVGPETGCFYETSLPAAFYGEWSISDSLFPLLYNGNPMLGLPTVPEMIADPENENADMLGSIHQIAAGTAATLGAPVHAIWDYLVQGLPNLTRSINKYVGLHNVTKAPKVVEYVNGSPDPNYVTDISGPGKNTNINRSIADLTWTSSENAGYKIDDGNNVIGNNKITSSNCSGNGSPFDPSGPEKIDSNPEFLGRGTFAGLSMDSSILDLSISMGLLNERSIPRWSVALPSLDVYFPSLQGDSNPTDYLKGIEPTNNSTYGFHSNGGYAGDFLGVQNYMIGQNINELKYLWKTPVGEVPPFNLYDQYLEDKETGIIKGSTNVVADQGNYAWIPQDREKTMAGMTSSLQIVNHAYQRALWKIDDGLKYMKTENIEYPAWSRFITKNLDVNNGSINEGFIMPNHSEIFTLIGYQEHLAVISWRKCRYSLTNGLAETDWNNENGTWDAVNDKTSDTYVTQPVRACKYDTEKELLESIELVG